ncbi:hypothetical protein IFR04_016192 [Cadophora malorum]|uniref:Uncharacterized protein n=1 Tax=Cadophora malorum TaxID=108018 RepID=A0A8H7T1Q3_9HELO|nr:hypothetical protein IFR04_016192 [Cadophora malorum]
MARTRYWANGKWIYSPAKYGQGPSPIKPEPDRSESESERLVEDPSLRAAYSESLKLLAILRSAVFPHPRVYPEPATGAELEEQSVTSDSTTEDRISTRSFDTHDETDDDTHGGSQEQTQDQLDQEIREKPDAGIAVDDSDSRKLLRDHELARSESLTIAELLVSHLQRSDGARRKKRTFDEEADTA